MFPHSEYCIILTINCFSWIDGEETSDRLVVVTEAVRPLAEVLVEIGDNWSDTDRNLVAWGLYQVASALAFFNDSKLVHANTNVGSIFVTLGGDWKLGSLDFLSGLDDGDSSLLMLNSALVPTKYTPPELAQAVCSGGQWSAAPATASAVDSWQLGCLIREAFGGTIRSAADLRNMQAIPQPLQPGYQKLLAGAPAKRLKPKALLESPFFTNNYIKVCLFLENLAIKDAYERDSFFKSLPTFCAELPQSCRRYKLLPELLKSVEFAGAGNWHLLAALLNVADQLPDDEYGVRIAPVIVRYFECNDRALRIALLQNMNLFIDKLSNAVVNDKLFPQILSGFGDSSAQLRELTVKSMLVVVPKLSPITVDTHVLKQFAKLQVDREPGIRTNTTICLGRIAPNLTPATRDKVLAAAFARALRDPFAPGRTAGLASLCATMRFYDADSVAKRIIPSISALGVDPDEGVREKVFSTLRLFVDRLEKIAAGIKPDTADDTAAAEKESAGMLGWLSRRIYGGADGGGGAAPPSPSPAKPSSDTATATLSTTKPTIASTTTAVSATTTTTTTTSVSAAKAPTTSSKLAAPSDADGWGDGDIDFNDDDDGGDDRATTSSSGFVPKKKSPYLDDPDDDRPSTSSSGKAMSLSKPASNAGDGWNEEFEVGDDDDNDGQWSFTPARVVATTAKRKGGKLAD